MWVWAWGQSCQSAPSMRMHVGACTSPTQAAMTVLSPAVGCGRRKDAHRCTPRSVGFRDEAINLPINCFPQRFDTSARAACTAVRSNPTVRTLALSLGSGRGSAHTRRRKGRATWYSLAARRAPKSGPSASSVLLMPTRAASASRPTSLRAHQVVLGGQGGVQCSVRLGVRLRQGAARVAPLSASRPTSLQPLQSKPGLWTRGTVWTVDKSRLKPSQASDQSLAGLPPAPARRPPHLHSASQ